RGRGPRRGPPAAADTPGVPDRPAPPQPGGRGRGGEEGAGADRADEGDPRPLGRDPQGEGGHPPGGAAARPDQRRREGTRRGAKAPRGGSRETAGGTGRRPTAARQADRDARRRVQGFEQGVPPAAAVGTHGAAPEEGLPRHRTGPRLDDLVLADE